MKKTTTVTRGELILEYIRQGVMTHIADFPQMTQSLDVIMRDCVDKVGVELAAMTNLPKEHLKTVEDYATFSTPKTWFQHFKASNFPQWLLKKFPVEYHKEKMKVVLKVGAVYPQLPEVYPKNIGQIRYSYNKNSPYSVYPVGNVGEDDF